MRTIAITILSVLLFVPLAASVPSARTLDGTVKLGGIIRNQDGDRSAVQETYNVYDGFAVSEIDLHGMLNPRHYVALQLQDLNLDSRRGGLVYRLPGTFKLTAGYGQHRQVFSPDGGVHSLRQDWRAGAEFTPLRWLCLSGRFNSLVRDGDRLPFPQGAASVLGTRYDNSLKSGEVTAEARRDGRGAAVSYRASEYCDEFDRDANRTGQVVSARLYAPDPFYGKWTHLLRGAYGTRKLSNRDLDHTLASFQYTGVVQPVEVLQLKYGFLASRTDDQAALLKTDRFSNSLEAAYSYEYGRFSAGYAYETNDDDRTLTSYHSWHAGTAFRYGRWLDAKADYASRVKKDEEELTLLKDVEASQVRAKLQVRPRDGLVLGGGYTRRQREFPDIRVNLEGDVVNAFGRYEYAGWGALSADYTFSSDDCQDLAAGFHTRSHVVTGRAEVVRLKELRLAAGVTWMDVRRDLDLEKSLVFVEGVYTVREDYHLEVKYNAYNYDDYILLGRYYTANVLRINLAYDLHLR